MMQTQQALQCHTTAIKKQMRSEKKVRRKLQEFSAGLLTEFITHAVSVILRFVNNLNKTF
jgi:hypothetical protein